MGDSWREQKHEHQPMARVGLVRVVKMLRGWEQHFQLPFHSLYLCFFCPSDAQSLGFRVEGNGGAAVSGGV